MTADRRDELTEDLPEIARHTSERERRADEAERELVQWKKVRFMADKVGDEFEGYITGVTAFGLFIELVEHFVEGLVHVSTMADDYYRFVEQRAHPAGEKTGRVYRLGDKVSVQVIKVDMERRQVDLGLTEILDRVRASESNRGPRHSRISPRERGRPAATGSVTPPRSGERPRRRPASASSVPGGRNAQSRRGGAEIRCCRHGRPYRSRQERARACADGDRSGSAQGGAGARDHHRPRVCAPRGRRT